MAVKRSRSSSRKMSGGRSKKLNSYFKKMLAAKKTKARSFNYKGKKYVGKQHPKLGMVYSSA